MMLRWAGALACAALCGLAPAQSVAQSVELPPELWDRPRTGSAILAQDSVRRIVVAALARPGAEIVIHHAPGQEPAVQAEELRSWLAALAIDSQRIALRADVAAGAPMRLEIVE
jgi:hypothetical protein